MFQKLFFERPCLLGAYGTTSRVCSFDVGTVCLRTSSTEIPSVYSVVGNSQARKNDPHSFMSTPSGVCLIKLVKQLG